MSRRLAVLFLTVLAGLTAAVVATAHQPPKRYPVDWKARYHREHRHVQRLLHQRRAQAHGGIPGIAYGIRLASALYGVPQAQMWAVTRCETADFTDFYNDSSAAGGWWQYLPSTWATQGLPGFSPYDPIASTLNTARIVAREGWAQWECKP